jgi:hypothetical protein
VVWFAVAEELGFKHGPVEIKGGAMKSERKKEKEKKKKKKRFVVQCE